MSTFTITALGVVALVELVALVFALALCRAAADRPAYGPPLADFDRYVAEYKESLTPDERAAFYARCAEVEATLAELEQRPKS